LFRAAALFFANDPIALDFGEWTKSGAPKSKGRTALPKKQQ
jgi:hypothetical protein